MICVKFMAKTYSMDILRLFYDSSLRIHFMFDNYFYFRASLTKVL